MSRRPLRQPTEDEATYLATVFGWPEDSVVETAASDNAALIAAIAAQTVAINDLVGELRRVADGQIGMSHALGQLAAQALGIRLPAKDPTGTQPPPTSDGQAHGAGRQ